MQTFTANEAKARFGEFIDCVWRGPVRVKRHGRIVGVMVSADDYEAMRVFYAIAFNKPWTSPQRVLSAQGWPPLN